MAAIVNLPETPAAGKSPAKIRTTSIFETPLIETFLDDASALNAGFAELIHARRDEGEGRRRSQVGGWRTDSRMLQWGGAVAKGLAQRAVELCERHTFDRGARPGKGRFDWGVEMWGNVCPPGASHAYHAHPGYLWSAVYYVDDGGAPADAAGGRLTFYDPRFPMTRMHHPDLGCTDARGRVVEPTVSVAPEPGKLVVFPAWLCHSVTAHEGPRPRVTVALNLKAVLGAAAGG